MKEEEEEDNINGRIWDCGSPLYDSYELASMAHLFHNHTNIPFFSSSTSNGRRLINMVQHHHQRTRFNLGSSASLAFSPLSLPSNCISFMLLLPIRGSLCLSSA
ncbi:hypothetical protein G4B88_006405 [Cannabis sativa]|uniref:Uncharacterized protein n=1 Tax=Cannabis sativa TaxID=3483 RepID=A0A7J6H290_CANSA|nr:hypothetical protein G4B88_006405 [Cannabis sativa]